MKVGLITIGNELLSGFTTDTNAAWIGQRIGEVGGVVIWHLTTQDSREDIIRSIESTPEDVQVLIITGGLGPTHDDITATSLYHWAQTETEFDEDYWKELEEKFKNRNVTIPEINKNQALKPIDGEMIQNPVGSARGIRINKNGLDIIALPGVPAEMKAMMTLSVIPLLDENIHNPIHNQTLRTTGIMESALAEKLEPILRETKVKLAFLPKLTGVDIRISSADTNEISELRDAIFHAVGKYIFGEGDILLEEAIGKLLIKKNLTIGVAESCTGGLISDRFTNVSGSSVYFHGGIIAYQNKVKITELNVKKETLETFGAVSEETAIEMAKGIQSRLQVNLGLSSTGIAGPGGGTDEKPVGLLFIALAHAKGVMTKKFNLTKKRIINKELASQAALNMIRIHLTRD